MRNTSELLTNGSRKVVRTRSPLSAAGICASIFAASARVSHYVFFAHQPDQTAHPSRATPLTSPGRVTFVCFGDAPLRVKLMNGSTMTSCQLDRIRPQRMGRRLVALGHRSGPPTPRASAASTLEGGVAYYLAASRTTAGGDGARPARAATSTTRSACWKSHRRSGQRHAARRRAVRCARKAGRRLVQSITGGSPTSRASSASTSRASAPAAPTCSRRRSPVDASAKRRRHADRRRSLHLPRRQRAADRRAHRRAQRRRAAERHDRRFRTAGGQRAHMGCPRTTTRRVRVVFDLTVSATAHLRLSAAPYNGGTVYSDDLREPDATTSASAASRSRSSRPSTVRCCRVQGERLREGGRRRPPGSPPATPTRRASSASTSSA